MNEHESTYNEIDDYIAELTEAERAELDTADAAIELAFLFHDAREKRGLTQAEAAQQAGLRQQAVSRFEQPDMKLANTKIETLRKYLAALHYSVQITLKDLESGLIATSVDLPPRLQQTSTNTMIVRGVKWQPEPTTPNTVIKIEEFNPPNVRVLPLSKGTAVGILLTGRTFREKANTAKGLDSRLNLSFESQGLMETHA
jgi:transcriptional regulator with XRE-family HTH domain